MKLRGSASIELALLPNSSINRWPVPHRAGDLVLIGGEKYWPRSLSICPMKPCGVQLARPILPPDLQKLYHFGGGPVLIRGKHHTVGRNDDVEARIGERQRFGIGLSEHDVEAIGIGARLAARQQGRNKVGRGHRAPAPRRGERVHCHFRLRCRARSDRRADRAPHTIPRRQSARSSRSLHSRRTTRRHAGALLAQLP